MRELFVTVESNYEQLERLQNDGKTAVFLAVDGEPWAILGLADTLKETSASAVRSLRSMGLNVIMLTGDNERTAKTIASSLNIDQVIANVRPDEKEKVIEKLQADGKRVAMVGDGINDAPALAKADVGIAIG